jgi:uncharacterized membrane protein YvbJ
MTICPHCGKEFLTGSHYCPYCDNKISTGKRKFSGGSFDLLNLERIPLKSFILPQMIGLGAIAVIVILFACII